MKISRYIKDSPTLKFSELAKERNRRRERIISLGISEPAFDTPLPIIDATYDAIKKGYTKYSNSLGLIELRELIRDKLLKDNGINASIENIVVTPGAKQALYLALMALLEPYDEVINITPCYVSYIPQIKIAEPTAVIHNIDLKKDDFSLDWEKIENISNKKTKVIIINFPHNPTGRMLHKDEMDRLAGIIRDKSCYIISDEIYEKLNFSGLPHYSIAAFKDISERTVTVNGFSKAFSMTGWRIGYLTANKEVIKIVSKIQQHINTNTCTFVQKGACAAFSLSNGHVSSYNKELKDKASLMADIIESNHWLSLVPPMGGLFAFLNISRTGLSSDDFSFNLLSKKDVAVIPGVSFGEQWDDHVRISLVAGKDEFEDGIKRIDRFVREIKGI